VTLAHNEGIAFSWLSHHPVVTRFVLIAFIVLICLSVALWLAQTPKEDVWSGCALGLILGGALGNLYDRILYGYVIDFIDIHYQHWHWFIFNVADSFISVGAAISVLAMLFCSEKRIRS
jgi:signal peptidase II